MLRRWFGRRVRGGLLCVVSLAGVAVVRDPGDKVEPPPADVVAASRADADVSRFGTDRSEGRNHRFGHWGHWGHRGHWRHRWRDGWGEGRDRGPGSGKVPEIGLKPPPVEPTVPSTTQPPARPTPTTVAPAPPTSTTAAPAPPPPSPTPAPPASPIANELPADLAGRSWQLRQLGRSDVSLGIMPTWTIGGVRMDHFNNEVQRYRDANVTFRSDGLISLLARSNDPASETGYTSGAFTAGWLPNQVRIGRGAYVQAAMKLPQGPGTWPALWLLDAPHTPDKGRTHEIDIMEAVGSEPGIVYHTTHFLGRERQVATRLDPTQWHTYGVWLADDGTHFFVDGKYVGSSPAVPANIQYGVMANLAIGDYWAGPPDPSFYPAEVLMTPVRIWTPA